MMCPMCEKRARLLLQQQAVVESTPASSRGSGNGDAGGGGKPSLFRNPFKACKNLTHRCCSPLCESNRTSMASGRRSSAIAPVPSTPEHSGELTYLVSESPLSGESKDLVGGELPGPKLSGPAGLQSRRKRKGLLRRLKRLARRADRAKVRDHEPDSNESSFAACARKVMAVAEELERDAKTVRGGIVPSAATLLAAETDMEDSSVAVTETNVSSESAMVSMMGFNGSFYCSPFRNEFTSCRGSTLRSSAYDDDASSFAVVPRTSTNSSYVGRDGASDASGLSDRFGELDIGYLSLEESGEGPDFDDTVSIASDQLEHLDLEMHQLAQDDVVSESDFDLSTVDSQEWVTETEDAVSILQRSRTHHNRDRDRHIHHNNIHRHHQADDQQCTPPPLAPLQASDQEPQAAIPTTTSSNNTKNRALFAKKDTTPPEGRKSKSSDSAKRTTNPKVRDSAKRTTNPKSPGSAKDATNRRGRDSAKGLTSPKASESAKDATKMQPPESTAVAKTGSGTEYLCSHCGRKELGTPEQGFGTYVGGEDQAVMAAKVVVLLGKYGNRKGLRVSGFTKEESLKDGGPIGGFSAKELERLRTMISPRTDAVSAFQDEVARMMLEGVDVPDLTMDVKQFIAGYMKLNSPFYVDLIEDFFKSVCMDCFDGHMESVVRRGVGARAAPPQRPAYAVLKPRKTKTIAVKANPLTTGKLPQ